MADEIDGCDYLLSGGPLSQYLASAVDQSALTYAEYVQPQSTVSVSRPCSDCSPEFITNDCSTLECLVQKKFYDTILTCELIDEIDDYVLKEERVRALSRRQGNKGHNRAAIICYILLFSTSFASYVSQYFLLSYILLTSICLFSIKLIFPIINICHHLMTTLMVYWNLKSFIKQQADFDRSIHLAIRAIRARETLVFGLSNMSKRVNHLTAWKCSFQPLRLQLSAILQVASLFLKAETIRISSSVFSSDESRQLISYWPCAEAEKILQSNHKTDVVTITSLKSLWQLYFLYRSEYLRCLAFIVFRKRKNTGINDMFLCMEKFKSFWISEIAKKLLLVQHMTAVQNCADIAFVDRCSDKLKREDVLRTETPLTSLLGRLRQRLAFALECLSESKWADVRSADNDLCTSMLAIISTVTKDVHECVEDFINKNNKSATDATEDTALHRTIAAPQQNRVIIINDQTESVPVYDQVFEATAEKEDNIETSNDGRRSEELISDQARAVSVVTELKSVLLERGEVMRERELKALAIYRQVPVEQLRVENNNHLQAADTQLVNEHQSENGQYSAHLAHRFELHADLASQLRARSCVQSTEICFEADQDILIEAKHDGV